MKRPLSAMLLSALFLCLLPSCDTGAGPDPTPSPEPSATPGATAAPVSTATPDPTPAPADPAVYGMWYAFAQSQYGLALTRSSQTFTATGFEQVDEYYDGDAWQQYSGIRGSLSHVDGPAYAATLTGIFVVGEGWLDSTWEYFDRYRGYVWSLASRTARVSLSLDSGNLAYKRDQDGDGAFDDAADLSLVLGSESATALPGEGVYPYLNYVGFNFHQSPTEAHIHLQNMSLNGGAMDGTAYSSVTVKVTNADSVESGDIALAWDADRQEWGRSPYALGADPVGGGLWWVSEVVFTGQTGYGSATYDRPNPWDAWNVSYTTDKDYASSATAEIELGQCNMPPNAAEAGETMYYITAVANSSSADYDSDLVLRLYASGDTEHWIALNDDGDTDAFPDMQVALANGGTYYLKVVDLNGSPGTYSLRLDTLDYDNRASTAIVPMGEDAYEDDDTPAGAEEIAVGGLQDRALTPGETDWVKIVVPTL